MPLKIRREMVDLMVAHARAGDPNEVCGLVAARTNGDHRDKVATNVYPLRSTKPSGGFFEIDPLEQIELLDRMHSNGLELGAIYHSHPHIQPVPSGVDKRYAENWPGVMWIILGVSPRWRWKRWNKRTKRLEEVEIEHDEDDGPELKVDVWTWWIEDDRVTTAELIIE